MNLFDLLACPDCRVSLQIGNSECTCPDCGRIYPIINGVPVFLTYPDGPGADRNQSDLVVRNDYDPWIPKTIMESLSRDRVILEVGSGNRALSVPNIIRLDVSLTPYVDLVADLHALPFLPECLDFIFSMAVVEHLYNPFQASRSMYDALKDGGYIYHECNFVYTYHGYPSHFFNATAEGMKSVFSNFSILRQGVAPYQMPSFALKNMLESYIHYSHAMECRPGLQAIRQMKEILDLDLLALDGYFTEKDALNLAAGTYLVGQKKKTPASTLIPPLLVQCWEANPGLQNRFPDRERIDFPDNLLIWAQGEGRSCFPEIGAFLDGIVPFHKSPYTESTGSPGPPAADQTVAGGDAPASETTVGKQGYGEPVPVEESPPAFGVSKTQGKTLPDLLHFFQGRVFKTRSSFNGSIKAGWTVLRNEGFRTFLGKLFRSWSRRLLY